tara:strand:- start:43 stop:411 length:369 start_codon:yes stop_codon:yes gene_type:complete
MNKEDKREYDKKYYETNKEKRDAQNKAWAKANEEKHKAYHKEYSKIYSESKKDGLFTVYLLPKENYVGQTSSLYTRLIAHKSNDSRDVSDIQILGKYKTREEAMEVEADYHSKGYLGYNKGN